MLKFDASIFGGELPVGLGVVGPYRSDHDLSQAGKARPSILGTVECAE